MVSKVSCSMEPMLMELLKPPRNDLQRFEGFKARGSLQRMQREG